MMNLKKITAALALSAVTVFGNAPVVSAAPAVPSSVDPKPCC